MQDSIDNPSDSLALVTPGRRRDASSDGIHSALHDAWAAPLPSGALDAPLYRRTPGVGPLRLPVRLAVDLRLQLRATAAGVWGRGSRRERELRRRQPGRQRRLPEC